MSNDYKINWPLPDEILIEIGRLSSLWASLESQLNLSIGKLAGFDEFTQIPFILTVHSSFPQRIDILATLCEQHLPQFPHLKDYKKTVSKIKEAQNLRNKYIHNGITQNPDNGDFELFLGSARQTLKAKVEKISSDEIHTACKLTHEALLSLHELITKKKYKPIWER